MGVKASEVGGWLRQRTGKRDHREIMSDDYVVIRPGPNFDWLMGNLAAGQPTPLAPEPDPASNDRHDANDVGRRRLRVGRLRHVGEVDQPIGGRRRLDRGLHDL
jgi:hypothetical protein